MPMTMPPPSNRTVIESSKSRFRGFTLLEILICVAITAVLCALAFAGYRQVSNTALGTRNISNHRTIIRALLAYSADFQGKLPFFVDYDPPFGNGASSAPNSYSHYPKTLCFLGYLSNGSAFFSPRYWPRWSPKDGATLVINNPTNYPSVIVPWAYTNYAVNRYGAMPSSRDERVAANLNKVGGDGNLSKLMLIRDSYTPDYDRPSMRRGGGIVWFSNESNIPPLEDCYNGMVHASFADGHVEAVPRAEMLEGSKASASEPMFSNIYTRR